MDDYMKDLINGNTNPSGSTTPSDNTDSEVKAENKSSAFRTANTPNTANPYQPIPSKTSGYAPSQQMHQHAQQSNVGYFNAQRPVAPPVQPQMAQGMQPVMPKPKKKKSKAVIVIVIIGILCFAMAAFGVVASLSGKVGYNMDEPTTSASDSGNSEDSKNSGKGNVEAEVEDSNSNPEKDNDGNLTAVGVVKNSIDSCVGITVYANQTDYYNFYNYGDNSNSSSGKQAAGEGSGVIMAEENGTTYIMTCAHVIEDGSSFKVTLENDKEYDATMVGYDSQTDIGVLAIKATGLKVAKFGNSEDIELGQNCVAIGCPGGLEFKNSVTQGIVSALAAPVQSSIGYKNECIQVDAPINPGNSGGALFNMQGQVIGINSSKIASTEYEGMGFAVPSNTAVKTANSLIKNGYVAGRAKIGVEYNSLSAYNSADSILQALAKEGYKDANGTMVIQNIENDSDLKNKDIKQYDMIVAVDGKTMTSTDVMTSKLADSKPGDTVTLTIARVQNNSIKTFEVKCKLIESKQ